MNLWSLHCLAVKSVQRQSSWNISRMSKLFKCMACVHTILIALIGVCKLVIHLGSFNGSVRWTGRNLKPFSEQLEMMNKSLHRVLESRECFCEQWHFEFNDCLFVRCKVNLGTRMWLSAEICNTSRSWNKFVIEGLVLSYGVICSPRQPLQVLRLPSKTKMYTVVYIVTWSGCHLEIVPRGGETIVIRGRWRG